MASVLESFLILIFLSLYWSIVRDRLQQDLEVWGVGMGCGVEGTRGKSKLSNLSRNNNIIYQ